MENKSVLEQALLEAQELEEAVKSNAKEILASTMKQEIEELVKESLNEQDEILDIEEFGDEEQEDLEDEVGILPNEEEEAMVSFTADTDEPLDLTTASDGEVLKVFKSMGAEDGIVVTQDDDGVIEIEDQEAGTEYKIELAENKLKNYPLINEEVGDLKEEDMAEKPEPIYEIELDEDDYSDARWADHYDKAAEDDYSQIEKLKQDARYDAGRRRGNLKERGSRRGDQSATHLDYEEDLRERGSRRGDQSATHLDYEEDLRERGSRRGDQSATHLDYEEDLRERGSRRGDQSATHLDYEEDLRERGSRRGDQSATHLDYEEEMDEGGAKKGDQSATHLDYEEEMDEASRTLGFGRESGGKHKPSGIRKAITNNRNLGSVNEIIKISKKLQTENRNHKEKNREYRQALKVFRGKLTEVAVFNANLAYSTKLFTEHTTTKREKINILRRFDNVKTLTESKSLYTQISSDLNTLTKSLNESVQKSITKTPSRGSSLNLIETKTYENPQISRMKEIMSKL